MRDIPALHGMRGVAALIVVVSHYSNASAGAFLEGRLGVGGGQVGVMLFFLISGFLMQYLYGSLPPTKDNVLKFAIRRGARVLPLYFFVVIASFLLFHRTRLQVEPITTSNIMDHLLLIKGTSTLWTIPVEVQFYVVFVLAWMLCSQLPRNLRIAIVASAVIAIMLLPADSSAVPQVVYCGHFFLMGLLVADVFTHSGAKLPDRVSDAVFVISSIAAVLIMPNLWHPTGLDGFRVAYWHEIAPLVVLTALLVSAITSPFANWLLGRGPMSYIGMISYSIYLLHPVVLGTVGMPFGPYVSFPFVVGIVLAISVVSYRVIEDPARRTLSRLRITAPALPTMERRGAAGGD